MTTPANFFWTPDKQVKYETQSKHKEQKQTQSHYTIPLFHDFDYFK